MLTVDANIEVKRDGEFLSLPVDSIVPGDIVKIETNAKIPADVVIMQGKCIVSEALLTGESTPFLKERLSVHDPTIIESKHVV